MPQAVGGTGAAKPEVGGKSVGATDIRSELADCLDTKWGSQSAFSFTKSYDDAPNPTLNLTNLGTIGLPLNSREANMIKSHAVQAPFGMGERTLVDKSVRDTWEMDAKMVAFENPKWEPFITRLVSEVCQTLGVNFAASQPRCELYKLLLYETGSHFLPHVDTEKADGMFATIIVVLPSQFSGGAAHLSHSGLSTVYDCSGTSLCSTTAMAWYTDVTHEIKPITSGYRLALAYNLIHTTTSLRPALSSNESSVELLRGILQSWTADNGRTAPNKIVYLLKHKYSQANLRASALKGIDANKAAILAMLCKELGFHLGLASVECKISGYADDSGCRYGRRRGYYDDWDDDPEDVDFAEVEDRDMTIEQLVDLDGKLVSRKLALADKGETIPTDLAAKVEAGPADSQEYEGYLGNGAGSLSRCYRRTVLVIWPRYSHFAIQYGEDNTERACSTLAGMTNPKPSSNDLALADFVLRLAGKLPAQAARAVCHAAHLWKNITLWTRAITTCSPLGKGLAIIDKDEILFDAVTRFGFKDVKSCLEILLKDDVRNSSRIQFLDAFQTWASSQKSRKISSPILTWIKTARETVISTLRSPTLEDAAPFVSLALQKKDLTFLGNTIMPQIKQAASPEFLRELAIKAYDEPGFKESPQEKVKILSDTMSEAISRLQFNVYPKEEPAPTYGWYSSYRKPQINTNFVNAGGCFAACVGRFDTLVDLLVARVTDMREFTPQQVQKHVKEVLLPVLEVVATRVQSGAQVPPSISKLLRLVIDAYVKIIVADPKSTTRENVRSLVGTATLPGGAVMFVTDVMPKIQDLALSETSIRDFLEELRAHSDRISFPSGHTGPTVASLLSTLSKKYAKAVNLNGATAIANALDFCLEIRSLEASTILVGRAVDPSKLTAQLVNTVLVPFIPELRRVALKYKMLDSFATTFQAIMRAWMEKVLGTKPADNGSSHLARLVQWTCNCAECMSIKNFLQTSREQRKSLNRIGAPRCKHLEGFLSRYARGACTWDVVSTTPRGFNVTKSAPIWEPIRWRNDQLKGETILKTVSENEAELSRILGPSYASIVTIIRGRAPPTQALSQTAAAGSSRTASAAGHVENPPAKKRKLANPNAAIDLT